VTSTRSPAATAARLAGSDRIELAIGGMTCASCAARVERTLNRIDGVSATVNYATERASVRVTAGLDAQRLVSAVQQAGYTAALPQPEPEPEPEPHSGPCVRVCWRASC